MSLAVVIPVYRGENSLNRLPEVTKDALEG